MLERVCTQTSLMLQSLYFPPVIFQEQIDMSDPLSFESSNGERVYYVYPRLKPFLNSKKIKAEVFSDKAGISRNTLSKVFSGLYVTDEIIDKCVVAMRSLVRDEFDFDAEKMAAQGFYKKTDVLSFIGNRPYPEVAKILGIEKYMLDWIVAGKKVSEEFHRKLMAAQGRT